MGDYGIVAKMFGDALFSGDRLNQQKAYAEQQQMAFEGMQKQFYADRKIEEDLRERKNLLLESAKKTGVRHIDKQQFESFVNQGYGDIMGDIKDNHHGNFQSWLNYADENGNSGYDKLDQLVNNPEIGDWHARIDRNVKWLTSYNDAASDPELAGLISDVSHNKFKSFLQENKTDRPTLHDLGSFKGLKSKLDHSYLEEITTDQQATWSDAAYWKGNEMAVARNMVLDLGISQEQALSYFDGSPEGNEQIANYMHRKYGQVGEYGTKEHKTTIGQGYAVALNSAPVMPANWSGVDYQREMDKSGASIYWSQYGGLDPNSRTAWTGFANKKEKRIGASGEIITDANQQLIALQSLGIGGIEVNDDGSITLNGVDMLRSGTGVYNEEGDRITGEDLASWGEFGVSVTAGAAGGAGVAAITGAGAPFGAVGGAIGGGLTYLSAVEQSDMNLQFEGFYIANKWSKPGEQGPTDHLALEFIDANSSKAQKYNELMSTNNTKPTIIMQLRDKEVFDDMYYVAVDLTNLTTLANVDSQNKDVNSQLTSLKNAGITKEKQAARVQQNAVLAQKSAQLLGKRFGGGDKSAVNNIVNYFGNPVKTQAETLGIDRKSIPLMLAEIMVTSEKDQQGNELDPMQVGQIIQQRVNNLSAIYQQPVMKPWLDSFASGDMSSIRSMYELNYDKATKDEIFLYAKMFSNLMN
jgi:hypothetical protein